MRVLPAFGTACGLCLWGIGASDGADAGHAPFFLDWGMPVAEAKGATYPETVGNVTGATLHPPGTPHDTQEVVGFFCGEAGLQKVQLVTGRYNKRAVMNRFRTLLGTMASENGEPDAGDPTVGTAYWGTSWLSKPIRPPKQSLLW